MTQDATAPSPLSNDEVDAYRLVRTGGDRSRLEWSGFKVYSQSDEDGILEEIFRRIGIAHHSFVEFGCETGLENNTRYLLEQGWKGLWIEGYPDYAIGVRGNFHPWLQTGRLILAESYVNRRNINDLINAAGMRGEIDLLSVDIDSNDYHVFEAIDVVNPRVVCLEHNAEFAPGESWIMPYNEDYRWDPHAGMADYGASLAAMAGLAERRGYRLVGCGLYSANGFYVRSDLVQDRFTGPFTAERLFNPMDYDRIVRFPRRGWTAPPPPELPAPPPPAAPAAPAAPPRGGLLRRLFGRPG